MYHWHPLMPDTFNISGNMYTVKEFLFRPDIVVKHGMREFVDGLVNSRAGAVSLLSVILCILNKTKLLYPRLAESTQFCEIFG